MQDVLECTTKELFGSDYMKKWAKPLLVAIIIFPLSLLMDLIMRKELNYFYALLLSIFFGSVFYLLQSFVSYLPLNKIKKKAKTIKNYKE